MISRRKFLTQGAILGGSIPFMLKANAASFKKNKFSPVVISTWDAGVRANIKAWELLNENKAGLDAV